MKYDAKVYLHKMQKENIYLRFIDILNIKEMVKYITNVHKYQKKLI